MVLVRLCTVLSWVALGIGSLFAFWLLVSSTFSLLDSTLPKKYPAGYSRNPEQFEVITQQLIYDSRTLRSLNARPGDIIIQSTDKLHHIDPTIVLKLRTLKTWTYWRIYRPLNELYIYMLMPLIYTFNFIMIGTFGFIPWKLEPAERK